MANEDLSLSEQFEEIASQRGWDDTQKLQVLFSYIENQGDDEAFLDFLESWGTHEDENEAMRALQEERSDK